MYAIVENNVPRLASNAAVISWIEGQNGGKPSMTTINRWDEATRNSFGVYTIVVQRDSLLPYQDHAAQPLSFDGVKVTQHFLAVDIALDAAKEAARSALAARRYEAEVGGIMVADVPVKTDRETALILTGARIVALEDPTFSVDWKVDNGVFVTLDATAIIAAADAVRVHVQNCFTNEKDIDALINAAADLTALRAIDINGGW